MQTVAVIGLGYVGLPLVVEFGKHTRTIGFDIVEDKVARCRAGSDQVDARAKLSQGRPAA